MGEPQPQVPERTADAETESSRITFGTLQSDPEILALIEAADACLKTAGYTDHGLGHVTRVGQRAYGLLKALEADERECELGAIAGLLHDIGNVIHREGHAHHSAQLCFQLLKERGMPTGEIATIMGAVANHDEGNGEPVSNPSAALNIADKSDVLRSRVRNPHLINFDIHDRVNYAAKRSELITDKANHLITLHLEIDTKISQVMEYFEIFMSRMGMCRKAANFLNCDFQLVINEVRVM
jgi:hypothetical protein